MDFQGYAIGGLAVGEPQEVMLKVVAETAPMLPARTSTLSDGRRHAARPHGGGRSAASTCSIACCRPATDGTAWPSRGSVRSISAQCTSRGRSASARQQSAHPAARTYSRAYLHHLTKANEILGQVLLSTINLAYYQELMAGMRKAITGGKFAEFQGATMAQWERGDLPVL